MKNTLLIKSILTLLLFNYHIYTITGQSQYNIYGSLKADNREGIPFAHVQLLDSNDSSFISGVISDVEGHFVLKHSKPGNYLIYTSYMGLEQVYEELVLSEGLTIDIGEIILHTSIEELSTITVTSERLSAVQTAGKTSYYIGQNIRLASRNSVDLLHAIPGVQIDLNQNIRIPGAEDILILVNGKEREVSFLTQLDPGKIEYIEINRTPGAKYSSRFDAVINIVLAHEIDRGLSGHINLTLPIKKSEIYSFPSANLTFIKDKNSFFASYEGGFSYFDIESIDIRRFDSIKTTREDFFRQENWSHRFHFGAERTFNSKSDLSLYGFIRRFSNEQSGVSRLTVQDENNNNQTPTYIRDENDLNKSVFISLFYSNRLNHKIDFEMESGFYQLKSNNLIEYDNLTSRLFFSKSVPRLKSWKSQINLKRVFFDNLSVEWGFASKFRLHKNLSVANFQYSEKAFGTYASSSYEANKISVIGGLRSEYLQYGSGNISSQWVCLPSLEINYRISDIVSTKLSYSKLVQVPTLNQVNPITLLSDRNSELTGNSNLAPSISHNLKASYSLTLGSSFLQSGLFHRSRFSVVDKMILSSESGIFSQQFFNLGNTQESGIEIYGSIRLGQILSISPQIRASRIQTFPSYYSKKLGLEKRTGWNLSSSVSTILNLPYDTHISTSFQYNARQVEMQYDRFEEPLYFISVNKVFFEKIKIGLTTALPFANTFTYAGEETETRNIYQQLNRNVSVSNVPIWINLSYSFKRGIERDKNFRKHSIEESNSIKGF